MNRRFGWGALAFCTALLGCGSSPSQAPAPDSRESTGTVDQALSPPTTITIYFPTGATLANTVLSATNLLSIGPGAVVGKQGDSLAVADFGSQLPTVLPSLSTVNGNVSSVAPVVVQTGAVVTGNVQSAGTILELPGATVKGTVTPQKPVAQTPFSWTVNLPSTNQGAVTVLPGQSRVLAPGAYGALTTLPGSTLSLSAGTYFFTAFDAQLASTIKVDESAGPVLIYDTGAPLLFGAWQPSGGTTKTNLLFVSLGTAEVQVGSPLAGTLVAPNAEVDLDLLLAPDVGQVFASHVDLFAAQTILLGGFNFGYFCPLGDSDGDGVSDCTDQCPLDPKKTVAGVCGCGVSETDTDHDGIPDCIDQCPNDPNKSVPGQCGCADSAQPAGTSCNDGICSGVGTSTQLTCNGSGQCGNPSACAPDPSCVAKVYNDFVYWICPGPATWSQAMTKCDAVTGQTLLEVDSREENAVLADLVTTPSWTGANDQGTRGTWTWAGTSVTGTTFYTNGATVPGSFSSWASGDPGDNAGQCGSFAPTSGTWSDASCSNSLGYVCKRSLDTFAPPTVPPITCGAFGSGLACPPSPSATCVPADPDFTDAAAWTAQVNTCLSANCNAPGAPGCSQCVGAAAVPPPGSTCAPYAGTSCGVVPGTEGNTCTSAGDCAAGQICGVTVAASAGSTATACTVCDNLNGDAGACTNPGTCANEVKHCGLAEPGCEPAYDGGLCREVVLCAPDGSAGIVDPRLNPGTNLTPTLFNPANEFEAGADATATYPPDPACPTPPCNLGPKNGWCTYLVPTALPQENPGNSNPANSGSGGVVQFDFDPNLSLHYDANPLAFGESNFDLTASASLTAGASFDIPLVGKSSFDILDALAMLTATRCDASTESSHLKVFGTDFLPSTFKFDTDPSVLDQATCKSALDSFETTVDRAKKALKDAEALLTQYNANKAAGAVFPFATGGSTDGGTEAGTTLCQQIAAEPPEGFPVGDCANETPEATINRFIQFYTSQVTTAFQTQLQLAANELKFTKDIPVNFVNNTEQQTLFEATFLIGPIPCLLQVQAVEGYGLAGKLSFGFNPGALLLTQSREQMANITGSVGPYANAGVSLFVGVGFDIGVASASAGVEGMVTLGNISAPITAGAGLDIAPEPDTRPLPSDLAALAGAVPLLAPMQYQFFLDYNYGAQVDINQILAGYLAARLEVSFLFWSASWTQEIVDFGNGFSLPPINLVSGNGSTPALGSFPWATVQMPTPFVSLPSLPVPATPTSITADGGPATVVPFDSSQVEKLFYNSLCTCAEGGVPDGGASTCFRNDDCCPAAPGAPAIVCFSDPALGGEKTCESCRKATFFAEEDGGCPEDSGEIFCGTQVPAQSCNVDTDCCQGPNGTKCVATTSGSVCQDNPGPSPQ
jgi:hypothetical protein